MRQTTSVLSAGLERATFVELVQETSEKERNQYERSEGDSARRSRTGSARLES
jgi:hypothetical protein